MESAGSSMQSSPGYSSETGSGAKNAVMMTPPDTKANQVFEVYERSKSEDLKQFSAESAIIKEMCNVVWRSLAKESSC